MADTETADLQRRIDLALACLAPVYELAAQRRRRRPAVGTLILAERIRRALTEPEVPGGA